MRTLALSKVYQLIEPGPVVLLTTKGDDGPNIMTMSWHMMLEFEPPRIACCVGDTDFSFAALDATGECVIGIPAVHLARKVVGIGNCHGNRIDKFATFGLTPKPGKMVKAPLILECFANLECKVIDRRMVRDYDVFILEVIQAWIDPTQKSRKTIHHHGYGKFVVDGRIVTLPSKMR